MTTGLLRVIASLCLIVVTTLIPINLGANREGTQETASQIVTHSGCGGWEDGQFEGDAILLPDDPCPLLTLRLPGSGAFISAPLEFSSLPTSLGAHWEGMLPGESKLDVAVRTSPNGTQWSEWFPLEAEASINQGNYTQYISLLASVLGPRFVQYKIILDSSVAGAASLSSIKLFALRSTPSSEASIQWHLGPQEALATIKPLGIVSRKQWGANESLRIGKGETEPQGKIWPEEVQKVEKIVVHHTAGANVCSSSEAYCQRRSVIAINDIYYYHTVVNGWGDIGYNSLIGYDGRIYEGRAGPEPLGQVEPLAEPVVGGHALGYNRRSHGIALMGSFQQAPVPELQYEALAKMVGWVVKSKLAAGGQVDPLAFSGYQKSDGGQSAVLPNIVGHRDVDDTECPGEYLYQRIVNLRYRAKRLAEWPPINVELRAERKPDVVAYHILVDNHEPDTVRGLTIKGAVPAGSVFVDSWAGSPESNRGVFDGSVVTWYDPVSKLTPGVDRREYVFVIRPSSKMALADIRAVAWVLFAEPTRGVSMSETVSADLPLDIVVDSAVGGRTSWTENWVESKKGNDYYGDGYYQHPADDGPGAFNWDVELLSAGLYEVYAWWSSGKNNTTGATYHIVTANGPAIITVNQQDHSGDWYQLGVFPFSAGTARITLTCESEGRLIADAVRFRQR
jgi:hypothetical protein